MPRYYIVELAGYSSTSGGGVRKPAVSLSVLDRAQNHLEVYRRYAGPGLGREDVRRKAVERECERLNNLDPTPFDCVEEPDLVHSTS